jgi:hypothetical protein
MVLSEIACAQCAQIQDKQYTKAGFSEDLHHTSWIF